MANPTISAIDLNLNTYKVYDATVGHDVNRTVQGTLYTVAGVTDANNQLRKLSIAELVMVVCLARATEKERAVINLMSEMSETTDVLNSLTEIEKGILDGQNLVTMTGNYHYNGRSYTSALDFLAAVGIDFTIWNVLPGFPPILETPNDDIITQIESKMDSLNSFSQQKMIELQSETNKRDQAYDMITNILKSLNTVEVGIVNNI